MLHISTCHECTAAWCWTKGLIQGLTCALCQCSSQQFFPCAGQMVSTDSLTAGPVGSSSEGC